MVADGNKHESSWFEFVKAKKGEYASKGYLIKTFGDNKAFDIRGGHAEEGKEILQYNIHQGGNQVWLVVPLEVPKEKK